MENGTLEKSVVNFDRPYYRTAVNILDQAEDLATRLAALHRAAIANPYDPVTVLRCIDRVITVADQFRDFVVDVNPQP